MKKLLALAAAALLVVPVLYAKEIDLSKAKCPFSGKDVVEESATDFNGGKVYFCCTNCPKNFEKKKDTDAKVASKANYQMVLTKQFKQEKCPLSGQDLNEDTKIKVTDVEVAFCCEKCQGKVQETTDKAKQIEMVFNTKAFKKAFKVEKPKTE